MFNININIDSKKLFIILFRIFKKIFSRVLKIIKKIGTDSKNTRKLMNLNKI